MIKFIMVDKL